MQVPTVTASPTAHSSINSEIVVERVETTNSYYLVNNATPSSQTLLTPLPTDVSLSTPVVTTNYAATTQEPAEPGRVPDPDSIYSARMPPYTARPAMPTMKTLADDAEMPIAPSPNAVVSLPFTTTKQPSFDSTNLLGKERLAETSLDNEMDSDSHATKTSIVDLPGITSQARAATNSEALPSIGAPTESSIDQNETIDVSKPLASTPIPTPEPAAGTLSDWTHDDSISRADSSARVSVAANAASGPLDAQPPPIVEANPNLSTGNHGLTLPISATNNSLTEINMTQTLNQTTDIQGPSDVGWKPSQPAALGGRMYMTAWPTKQPTVSTTPFSASTGSNGVEDVISIGNSETTGTMTTPAATSPTTRSVWPGDTPSLPDIQTPSSISQNEGIATQGSNGARSQEDSHLLPTPLIEMFDSTTPASKRAKDASYRTFAPDLGFLKPTSQTAAKSSYNSTRQDSGMEVVPIHDDAEVGRGGSANDRYWAEAPPFSIPASAKGRGYSASDTPISGWTLGAIIGLCIGILFVLGGAMALWWHLDMACLMLPSRTIQTYATDEFDADPEAQPPAGSKAESIELIIQNQNDLLSGAEHSAAAASRIQKASNGSSKPGNKSSKSAAKTVPPRERHPQATHHMDGRRVSAASSLSCTSNGVRGMPRLEDGALAYETARDTGMDTTTSASEPSRAKTRSKSLNLPSTSKPTPPKGSPPEGRSMRSSLRKKRETGGYPPPGRHVVSGVGRRPVLP